MKRLLAVAMLAACALVVAPARSHAYVRTTVVSVDYFYDALAPYGSWIDYAPYGWCWTPGDVYAGWRPYTDGYWAWSDYGWTWVADEPWGWAPYHYGRWLYDPFYGWLWVPGTEWGPAWVAWSESDDWVGWAPLPPFSTTYVSFTTGWIPANRWCFVSSRAFFDRDLRYAIVPIDRNPVLLGHCVNATRYTFRGGHVFDRGVSLAALERRTGHAAPRFHVVDAGSPARGRGVRMGRDALAFFRPAVHRGRGGAPPVAARVSGSGARRAWQDSRRHEQVAGGWRGGSASTVDRGGRSSALARGGDRRRAAMQTPGGARRWNANVPSAGWSRREVPWERRSSVQPERGWDRASRERTFTPRETPWEHRPEAQPERSWDRASRGRDRTFTSWDRGAWDRGAAIPDRRGGGRAGAADVRPFAPPSGRSMDARAYAPAPQPSGHSRARDGGGSPAWRAADDAPRGGAGGERRDHPGRGHGGR